MFTHTQYFLSLFQVGSPFREPLMKFLLRYPSQTVDFFLTETNIKEHQYTRFFEVCDNVDWILWLILGHSIALVCNCMIKVPPKWLLLFSDTRVTRIGT